MGRSYEKDDRLNDIGDKIIECIKSGIHKVVEIKEVLRLNRATVDNYLRVLEEDGLVHHIKANNPKGGYINHWVLGAGEDAVDEIEIPRVILTPATAIYPVVGRRDPLVAAIHGPANRYAARCTACGMEQGAGHSVNCLVALVAA